MTATTFDSTLGALEIAIIGAAFLFGIITVQTYIYYRAYPEDSIFIKILVASVWSLELGHTIVVCHFGYLQIIKKFGNPALLGTLPNSLAMTALFEGLSTFLAHAFFIFRIYRLYEAHYLALCGWFLAFIRLVANLAMAVICLWPHPLDSVVWINFQAKWAWLVELVQSMGAFIDVLIAIALCMYYLRNNDTELSSTKRLIDKLILWAISTGVVTSVVSVLGLLFLLTMPNTMVWLIMCFWLANVYSNSLMAR
ncbi:hypothetical protein B0H13DRAFT_2368948 [Mycena leptocephala]|nr:hypothetical protein B0H13DRAFT_2368948 [Mycena leptocephala]